MMPTKIRDSVRPTKIKDHGAAWAVGPAMLNAGAGEGLGDGPVAATVLSSDMPTKMWAR